MSLVLQSYWRSSAAQRVRIALNLRGLKASQVAVDLRSGAQSTEHFRSVQPQGLIPAFEGDDGG
jgi:maleylpyruvate isomerase